MYMTTKEKQVSFLNNYFVFRKMTNVSAEKLEKNNLTKNVDEEEIKPVEEPEEKPKKILIKRKKRVSTRQK